jgi:hypothetical protein
VPRGRLHGQLQGPAALVGRERLHLAPLTPRRVDQVGDVDGDQTPPERLLERAVQNAMNVADCLRRLSRGKKVLQVM